jgi:hypothetical protein
MAAGEKTLHSPVRGDQACSIDVLADYSHLDETVFLRLLGLGRLPGVGIKGQKCKWGIFLCPKMGRRDWFGPGG